MCFTASEILFPGACPDVARSDTRVLGTLSALVPQELPRAPAPAPATVPAPAPVNPHAIPAGRPPSSRSAKWKGGRGVEEVGEGRIAPASAVTLLQVQPPPAATTTSCHHHQPPPPPYALPTAPQGGTGQPRGGSLYHLVFEFISGGVRLLRYLPRLRVWCTAGKRVGAPPRTAVPTLVRAKGVGGWAG